MICRYLCILVPRSKLLIAFCFISVCVWEGLLRDLLLSQIVFSILYSSLLWSCFIWYCLLQPPQSDAFGQISTYVYSHYTTPYSCTLRVTRHHWIFSSSRGKWTVLGLARVEMKTPNCELQVLWPLLMLWVLVSSPKFAPRLEWKLNFPE